MVQIARVTRLLGDGLAEIAVQRKSACGHDCAKCGGGCSEMLVQNEVTARAENPLRAQPGDLVQVESATGQVISIAAVVYLVPLVLFFLLYFAGQYLFRSEGAAAAAGVFGFCLGMAGAVVINGVVKRRRMTSFHITAIVEP